MSWNRLLSMVKMQQNTIFIAKLENVFFFLSLGSFAVLGISSAWLHRSIFLMCLVHSTEHIQFAILGNVIHMHSMLVYCIRFNFYDADVANFFLFSPSSSLISGTSTCHIQWTLFMCLYTPPSCIAATRKIGYQQQQKFQFQQMLITCSI